MRNARKTKSKALLAFVLSAACALSSFPGTVMAATKTTAVKQVLPTITDNVTSDMSAERVAYYMGAKGSMGIWNDSNSTTLKENAKNGIYQISDEGLNVGSSISSEFYEVLDDYVTGELRPRANYTGYSIDEDGNVTNGPNWAYQGFRLKYTWDSSNQDTVDAVPDEYWGNTMDLTPYEEDGYLVFEIESVTGDAENTYLTIGAPRDVWAVPMSGEYPSDSIQGITKENYPNIRSSEHFKTRMAGVKLTDYYDVSKGGAQNVAVPLSAFRTADFNDIRWKAYSDAARPDTGDYRTQVANWPFRLDWVHTWGIARLNSAADDQSVSVKLNSVAVVEPQVPELIEEDVMVNDDGTVEILFNTTSDTDVSYKIARYYGSTPTYLDVEEDGYVMDTTRDTRKTYTYKVVAVDNTYGIMAESNGVVVEGSVEETNPVEVTFPTKYVEDGTGTGLRVYIGDHNEWADYGYGATNPYVGSAYKVIINNPGVDGDSITDTWLDLQYSEELNPVTDYTADGVLWGYSGIRFAYGANDSDKAAPLENWGNVHDLTDIEDSAYAVFEVSEVTGDADNAYLAITASLSTWSATGTQTTGTLTPDNLANGGQSSYANYVIGAKLTDYYDVEKGGSQIVAVPLSKLVDDPDLKEIHFKNWSPTRFANESKNPIDLTYFNGMGIARKDSGDDENATFSAKLTQLAVVNPAVPSDLEASRAADGTVTIEFLPSSDTGATSKIVRRSGSEVKYFDAPDGTFVDTTTNPKKAYTYSAVSVEPTYGIMSAESEPVTVSSSIPATSVVKEYMDWKKWADAYVGYDSYIGRGNWYYGDLSIWNDGAWVEINRQGVYTANIADPDVEGVNFPISDRVCVGNYSADYSTADFVTPPTSDGKLWAFVGPTYAFYKMQTAYDEDNNAIEDDLTTAEYRYLNVPDKYWLDVMDISAYEDTGYISMTISGVSGDVDNAYIVLTAATGTDTLRLDGVTFPITKEAYPNWGDGQTVKAAYVVGVPLKDYYDVEVGGSQTVYVPISELVNDPEFKEVGIKDPTYVNKVESLLEGDVDLRLFHGMGVAKKESATGDQVFTANISDFRVLAADAPTELTAVRQDDGSVKVNFEITTDSDVDFKVVRRTGRETVYFDAPDGEYVDTTTDPAKNYTYSAIAVASDYDMIQSSESNSVYIDSLIKNQAILYAGAGETKYETKYTHDGTMTAEFYSSEEPAVGYIASYADGKLKAVECVDVDVETWASASLDDCEATDTVKVFMWNAAQAPVITPIVSEVKGLKVLAIGDSASVEATAMVNEIAAADDVDVDVTVLSQEGATLATHQQNVANATAAYTQYENGTEVAKKVTVADTLAEEEYDIIVLQQATTETINAGTSTYDEAVEEQVAAIVEYLAENEPEATVQVLEPWAYESTWVEENWEEGVEYDCTDLEMFWSWIITDATTIASFAEAAVIPVGSAVYSLMAEGAYETIWSDGHSLSVPDGQYLAGLVCYQALTGNIAADNAYEANVTDADALKTAAAAAFEILADL